MQRLLFCLLLVWSAACGERARSIDPALSDSGTAHDAWLPPDTEVIPDAAVVPTPDAAVPTPDAAIVHPDASVPRPDASTATDASVVHPATDAGVTSGPGAYENLFVDGNAVSVYLPNFGSDASPVPVVLSLHGLSIPAIAMADITGLPAVADKEGFIAVFPAGAGGTWNTGGAVCGLGSFAGNAADDAAYIEHILDAVHALHPIDRTRVFVSGFSMGGYGSNALACHHPERFRAAAPASGGFPTSACAPGPVPVMIFHGTSDGTISHQCGVEARAAWVAHNGCSLEVDTVMVMGGKCEWNRGCPANGQVVFCSFQGMGHGWAGSLNPFALGGTQFESATALMWNFFKTYL